ncbi:MULTISPECIES: STAS domain-containing protein [Marinomonas]|uniref:STAS domain-containing protein n=1 Tax=Marinomonas rhodophyticola TaxID=2992803 RepID=A0ABT3KAI9_9GAMM|nr:STAS domain-containing protein [Marinomonas sp. KJ51-3]MCW4627570.1 STAS domain-containing protein [Marinomonas sp. KJ51-3]MCW4627585.1 STAS domain-containing protein [Marinomonas sp. KJ51-3]
MSISVSINNDNDTVTIAIVGSFDFSLFNDFRAAYSNLAEHYALYVIDMSTVEYLDSAALGMLLSMRNAIEQDSKIQLKGANAFIKNILMISRFDKRFDIQ